MAGRGRGSGLSLTQEQLAALGIARGESTAPTLAPPPLFPKLETKPLPLPNDATIDYMLLVQQQFAEHLLESPAYVRPRIVRANAERYSDKYKMLSADAHNARTVECVWNHVPAELRPSSVRARGGGARNTLKRKLEGSDIARRLQTLEKKEMKEEVGAGGDELVARDGERGAGEEEEDEEVEEEQEYEADDGTDYANNYFDNGEELDDEDDNLDDGPVY